ncbi:MAG: adenylyl-sulfate kinase [Gammaproteobacteria bacterium]|nr:MAG: adenylyl-sulfate kinase [Gammaproteobacteria bacterium]
MYIETSKRSLIKGVSWRFVATTTTIIIVYVFFGRLDLAIAAGVLETFAKIFLYFFHERIWQRIKFGRQRIDPFNLWFTGLPLSGKTTLADAVFSELKKSDIPLERIDSKDIRDVIPNVGFEREERHRHLTRVGHLIKTLQNNSVSSIASFVSPYKESRQVINDMTNNYVEVYVKTSLETCKQRDYKGVYQKALSGELKNFTGISDVYDNPESPHIIIDTDTQSIEQATATIVQFVKKHYMP